MSFLELAQAYAQACRQRDMALSQLADIGAGYAEKMDDFVRVVRCKDCASCTFDSGKYYCGATYKGRPGVVQPDEFCSYGERKQNGI